MSKLDFFIQQEQAIRRLAVNIALKDYTYLLERMFAANEPKLIDKPATIESHFKQCSLDERIAISIALDLWNGSGFIPFGQILDAIDRQSFRRFLEALETIYSLRFQIIAN